MDPNKETYVDRELDKMHGFDRAEEEKHVSDMDNQTLITTILFRQGEYTRLKTVRKLLEAMVFLYNPDLISALLDESYLQNRTLGIAETELHRRLAK